MIWNKMMWNKTVTLYIDDSSIRLMVVQGQRIKKWADLKLEPGLVKNSVVMQKVEVANKIKQLLQSQKVKTRKVILGYSGLHSLTRPATLPQLPKAMLAEAVAREARRVLPVPLDQLYLTWRTVPSPKGKIQVFLVTTPRKTADSLVETLNEAGLVPSQMTIKPLALTRALPENTAILVDVQPTEFDIVIMADGIPQPVRTMTFPTEEISWTEKMKMITSDLDRTIKFFDTNNAEKPLNKDVPIFVSGELIGKPELQNTLSTGTGHPVKILTPTLKGPEQIDIARYMMNIALATKSSSLIRDMAFPVSHLNMLPAPYQPKPMSLTKVFGIPGGVAVAALVVPMVMLMQGTNSNITTLQNQLDSTNEIVNQKTAQKAALKKEVTGLETQSASLKMTFDNLQTTKSYILTSQEHVNGDIAITLGKLMPTITLTSISVSDETLILAGTAPNQQNVYSYAQVILSYARQLDLSTRFTESCISSIKVNSEGVSEGEIIEFTLTFNRNG